ncbi:SMAD/FHA domain-containing protein [Syncephalastrum racemosum]|uniref:SMAD/FHA domain-containing protein n=1 Tax=Syncephalastrum racemosum TaxID=13706 RepID=A0A1X2HHQ0_SYNRA|nr:SMAD/FHA domain-containing protein [Syncephalastrum racemosum]
MSQHNVTDRFIYYEEYDLWYDTEDGHYYKYDHDDAAYIPVGDIDQDEPTTTTDEAVLRMVVLASDVVPRHHLVLVDDHGLTVGRDRSWDQRLRLAEMAVSRFHCQIYFDRQDSEFYLLDTGSQHGTLLNGTRLSAPKSSSAPVRLHDGDIITIASTLLHVHLHPSGLPCDLCSTSTTPTISTYHPEKHAQSDAPSAATAFRSVESDRRQEQERLRTMFLGNTRPSSALYHDRAQDRRRITPKPKPPARPTAKEVPQTDNATSAAVQNVGNQMLQKMGWKQGERLGREGNDAGLLEPISVTPRHSRSGLGASTNIATSDESRRQRDARIAKERYQ